MHEIETCYQAWVSTDTSATLGETETVIRAVRRFLLAHYDARLKPVREFAFNSAPSRQNIVGYRDEYGIYVLPEQMSEFGFAEKTIVKALLERGFLERKNGKHLKSRKLMGGTTISVYVVNRAILDGGET
jgi:hypothetical protein